MSVAKPKPSASLSPGNWWRWLPLGGLLALFVAADVMIAAVVDAQGDEEGGFILGITFSQVVLLAVWTALAPARLITRTLTGFIGATLLGMTLVACIYRVAPGGPQAWLFFGIVLTIWLAIQVPLWIFRWFGWRLSWPGEEVGSGSQRDLQFGIGQLMTWTALVAVALGIGRILMPDDLEFQSRDARHLVSVFATLTVFSSLLAWPVVWSTLAPRWWFFWIAASGCCIVFLTVVEIVVFSAAMGRGSGDEEIFWIMNVMQALIAGFTLMMMRASGFRLVRVGT